MEEWLDSKSEMFYTKRSSVAFFSLISLLLLITLDGCNDIYKPSLEEQAQSLDKRLICPVCPGESIDQSQTELAYQMKAVVREKLLAGWSPIQIEGFFIERYGQSVLAAPPKSGFNLIVWIIPGVVLIMGFLLLLIVIRQMKVNRKKSYWQMPYTDKSLLDYPFALIEEESETGYVSNDD